MTMTTGKVKCLECGVVLESRYRHDYKTCKCPNETMVDGGEAYLRYGGKDLKKVHVIQQPDEHGDFHCECGHWSCGI